MFGIGTIVNGILGGGGLGGILGGIFGNRNAPAAAPAAAPEPKKDNTLLYLIGGGFVLVLMFLLFKK